jgi:hypothetical protein
MLSFLPTDARPEAVKPTETRQEASGILSSRNANLNLIDRVVHHLPHQMVQPIGARATDVHARSLAYWLQALEHLSQPFRDTSAAAASQPQHKLGARPLRHCCTCCKAADLLVLLY